MKVVPDLWCLPRGTLKATSEQIMGGLKDTFEIGKNVFLEEGALCLKVRLG